MTKQELFENIQRKKSFLCVGLDTDINKIPEFMFDASNDPVFEFNKQLLMRQPIFVWLINRILLFTKVSG